MIRIIKSSRTFVEIDAESMREILALHGHEIPKHATLAVADEHVGGSGCDWIEVPCLMLTWHNEETKS